MILVTLKWLARKLTKQQSKSMNIIPKPPIAYKIEKLKEDILANKEVDIQSITRKEREEYRKYTQKIFKEKIKEAKEFLENSLTNKIK